MRLSSILLGSIGICFTHLALADEQPIVWAKFDTQASRADVAEIACALDARAVIDGRNRPIDVRVKGADSDCPGAHADGIRATVRLSGTTPVHVVFEMQAPEGTSAAGQSELTAALKETSEEINRRAARVAPAVIVVQSKESASVGKAPKDYTGGDFIPVHYNGGPIPEHTKIENRPNWDVFWIGMATFGAFYGGSLLYAMGTCGAQQGCRQGSEWLYVPGFGPFVTAGQSLTSGGATLAVFDGVVQSVGLGVAALGLFAFPRKFVVADTAKLEVHPISVPSGIGVGLTVTEL